MNRPLPPALRLTAAYAAIIMLISLVFSVVLYGLLDDQLNRSLRRQYVQLQLIDGTRINLPTNSRQVLAELTAGERRLQLQLIYFNLVILVLGGGASYLMAKRTLRPIEQALEAQTRFAADASHELRTPLAAMQTEIEVALRDEKLPATAARELLVSNLEEIAKLKALSDGLLQLARQEKTMATMVPANVNDVAENAVGQLRNQAKAKNIVILNQAAAVNVMADPAALTEILVILLDNAVKYSPSHTEVALSTRVQGKYTSIMVSDEGQGINPIDLAHIFDRFYRSDTSRSKGKIEGYGLGLAIAKQITATLGGAITAQNNKETGATFTVRLPNAASNVV